MNTVCEGILTIHVIIINCILMRATMYMSKRRSFMTILTVIVPSYNTQRYLGKCIDSLLESGDGIEILIVNDGSSDNTGVLADQYAKLYPDKVRAIHQDNAGHGGAINTGIEHAQGQYIKVLDSDDWVNSEVLKDVVHKLKYFIENEEKVDMMLTDFVYDKIGETKKKIMNYKGVIPKNKIITWHDVGRFKAGKYILMHSVIYSKQVLLESELVLPKHTFYVDNLFVYQPLPYVKTIYYMDRCLYHYLIGRDEQSVSERNMMKRIDQQLRVNRIMLEETDVSKIKDRRKKAYMLHYLTIVSTVSSIILIKIDSADALDKKKALWQSIKTYDWIVFMRMRTSLVGSLINLPGITGRKISLFVYKKAQQHIGFN